MLTKDGGRSIGRSFKEITMDNLVTAFASALVTTGLLGIFSKAIIGHMFGKELELFKAHISILTKLKTDEQTQLREKQRDAILSLWEETLVLTDLGRKIQSLEDENGPANARLETETMFTSALTDLLTNTRANKIFYPPPIRKSLRFLDALANAQAGTSESLVHLLESLEGELSDAIRSYYFCESNYSN